MKMDTTQIIEDLVLVKLTISAWFGKVHSRKAETELEDTHNAAVGSVDVRVRHLADVYSKPIQSAVGNMRRYWYDHTLPWEDGGWRVVGCSKYAEVMEEIAKMKRDMFEPPVEKLLGDYDKVREEARVRLNGLWDGDKFPHPAKLTSMFSVEMKQTAITNPGDIRFRGLGSDEVDAIKASVERDISAKIEGAVKSIIERLRDAVSDVSARMNRDPKNERVKYRGLWRTLKSLCETVPGLNITNNPQINSIVKKIDENIASANPETLRDSRQKRESLRKAAEDILSELDSFSG
jgi:hypothetical protein